MSFELWTWLAIIVLVLGSLAVFAWFLVDVRRVVSGEAGGRPSDGRDR